MTDLQRRFATLDAIPARLTWADVERRVIAGGGTAVVAGRPKLRQGDVPGRRIGSRGLALLAAAMFIATAAGAAALVGSRLSGQNSVPPSTAPAPAGPSTAVPSFDAA